MTQDQCLDNGHQAASSSHSANDKTSDDPNNSNNSTLKSGINTAQEFNVDVNSKRIDHQSADVVIVQNVGLDVDRSSGEKVLTTIDNLLDLKSNFVESNDNIVSNAIDQNLTTKMTVITHQSSDENIREIILHPEELNKIPNDSQVNNEPNLINEQNYGKAKIKDKYVSQSKSDLSNKSDIDKPEDPIERLNKLRASISSALSEVKGVLKQYSTDQSFDGELETPQSTKPADEGPVKFRFLRKIRRRSVFSDDSDNVNSQNSVPGDAVTLNTESKCEPNIVSDNRRDIIDSGNGQTISSHVAEEQPLSSNEKCSKDIISIHDNANIAVVSGLDKQSTNLPRANDDKINNMMPIVNEENINIESVPETEHLQTNLSSKNNNKNNSNDVVSKKTKMVDRNINLNNIENPLSATTKTIPAKKLIKKDRRASVTLDKTSPQLDLKAQRRPSDSGTIVKQPTRTKTKTCEKPKSSLQVISSTKPVNKLKSSVIINLEDTPSQLSESQKVDAVLNSSENSTENVNAVSKEETAIQAENITSPVLSIQIMNHPSDNLNLTTQLEPREPNTTNINQKTEVKSESIATVQNKEEIDQNNETLIEAKANIQEDLTSSEKTSLSVECKPDAKDDTIPIIKEETKPLVEEAPAKKKKKAKRKVVIRRIKRKLSKEDTFIQVQETPSELEIEEKEIEEQDANDDVAEEAEVPPKQRKPCIKARQFEIGDIVMYAERYKKTQVKWRKAKIIERITSISYKLDIDGEEKPAHISYIKKFTDRKVNFGGKEYLEIDYAQIEEDEEKERNYSIWNLV